MSRTPIPPQSQGMRIYLDDDSVHALLARFLLKAGHDVLRPADVGLVSEDDPVHLTFAIRDDRVLLSRNHDDFENLHDLVMQAGGHHPGILIVRRDNDPTRDLKPKGIVVAIAKLIAAGTSMTDEFQILNHWR